MNWQCGRSLAESAQLAPRWQRPRVLNPSCCNDRPSDKIGCPRNSPDGDLDLFRTSRADAAPDADDALRPNLLLSADRTHHGAWLQGARGARPHDLVENDHHLRRHADTSAPCRLVNIKAAMVDEVSPRAQVSSQLLYWPRPTRLSARVAFRDGEQALCLQGTMAASVGLRTNRMTLLRHRVHA